MTDVFPDRLKDAAKNFSNQCTAFALFRVEGGEFMARMQATEIMKQFVGDVTFCQDPKGVLFYRHVSDFALSNVQFAYKKTNGPNNLATIQVDFFDKGQPIFAQFLARFDTKKYPIPLNPTAGGEGRWTNYIAGTTQATAIRAQESTRLYLQLGPVRKEVFFQTPNKTAIASNGVLIFRDLKKLKDYPLKDDPNYPDDRRMVADFAPDRIVFRLIPKTATEKIKEFGLFLPVDPIDGLGSGGSQTPETTWQDFTPDTTSFLAFAEKEQDEILE